MSDAQWTPLLVGLVIAVVVGGMGGLVLALRRRRTCEASEDEPAPATAPAATHDPFVHGSLQDKRQALRRRGRPVDVLVKDPELEQPPVRATVLDRSVGGLRILAEQPFEVGTRLNLRVAHAPEMIPWVRIEVKNRLDVSHGCELGCKFVQTPPASVLWLFG